MCKIQAFEMWVREKKITPSVYNTCVKAKYDLKRYYKNKIKIFLWWLTSENIYKDSRLDKMMMYHHYF